MTPAAAVAAGRHIAVCSALTGRCFDKSGVRREGLCCRTAMVEPLKEASSLRRSFGPQQQRTYNQLFQKVSGPFARLVVADGKFRDFELPVKKKDTSHGEAL